MTITFLLFTVSQMAYELQANGATMDTNSVNTIKYRSMAYVRQMHADIAKRSELAIKLYGEKSMQYFQLFAEHNMINEQVDEVNAQMEGGKTEFGLKNKALFESTHLAFFKVLEAHEKSGELSPIIERSAMWKNMRLDNMMKVIKFESFKLEAYLVEHSAKSYQETKEKKIEISKFLDNTEYLKSIEAALLLQPPVELRVCLTYQKGLLYVAVNEFETALEEFS